ncbi:MAG: 30S ribosomal protein S6 [Calditrichaeota bacterium]|nr:30S ribosomal protein S6 [Calditrichota bacterium]MCB9366850.1 30S ribosomal protein S6 [Calditrichota bacterium]
MSQTKTYEMVLIFDPNVEPEQVEHDLKKINDYVLESRGTLRRWERWGKRRLAYEIRHRQYGHYVLSVYDLPTAATIELDRLLHLTTSLLRNMITIVDPERVPEVDQESVSTMGVVKQETAAAETGAEGAQESASAAEDSNSDETMDDDSNATAETADAEAEKTA